MPEIDRPKTADYYDDYEGPDRVRPWRDVIDWRRVAIILAMAVPALGVMNPDTVFGDLFAWVMALLWLAIILLAVLYLPAKWAIRFVLKR